VTFVENMPLNGRNSQTLIMLTPGVVVSPAAFDDQGLFSVNGQRAAANYFTVDGVSADFGVTGYFPLVQVAGGGLPALSAQGGTNSLVSVDAMQEFRVQTSSFAPEFQSTCRPCATAAKTFPSSSSISLPAWAAECGSRSPASPAKPWTLSWHGIGQATYVSWRISSSER